MTSLAKQLERLAVPHIRAVYGEDKRRKSLLFDPKEAAALDKEAIYAIGGCVFDTNIFLLKCWFHLFNHKKLDNSTFYDKLKS